MDPVLLTEQPLDAEGFLDLLDPTEGAAVVFAGCVRDKEDGAAISAIRYEAYVEMARETFAAIARDAREEFGARVFIRHRLGRVGVGRPSLVVICASPHRKEAFAAAQSVVERIKRDVAIWKIDFERA